MEAKPARLDPHGTEQPKTRIVSHFVQGHCIGPGMMGDHPELEDIQTGERIPLEEDSVTEITDSFRTLDLNQEECALLRKLLTYHQAVSDSEKDRTLASRILFNMGF